MKDDKNTVTDQRDSFIHLFCVILLSFITALTALLAYIDRNQLP